MTFFHEQKNKNKAQNQGCFETQVFFFNAPFQPKHHDNRPPSHKSPWYEEPHAPSDIGRHGHSYCASKPRDGWLGLFQTTGRYSWFGGATFFWKHPYGENKTWEDPHMQDPCCCIKLGDWIFQLGIIHCNNRKVSFWCVSFGWEVEDPNQLEQKRLSWNCDALDLLISRR